MFYKRFKSLNGQSIKELTKGELDKLDVYNVYNVYIYTDINKIYKTGTQQ